MQGWKRGKQGKEQGEEAEEGQMRQEGVMAGIGELLLGKQLIQWAT